MLSPGQWAPKREDALDVLAQLVAALKERRRLEQSPQK
jgi:hypothetical protein